jgi:tetratricopeptide (TPR) repeat protein
MLMRCMMAVMLLLGFAPFTLARGQEQAAKSSPPPDTVLAHINETDDAPADGTTKARTVDVQVLQMPKKAWKEVYRTIDLMRAGDEHAAVEHMEKVVEIDPELPVAHNALGVMYVDVKAYDKAQQQFEQALTLKRDYRLAADNITVVLCLQHRYAEAEPAARRALDIDPEAASSQYLLGSILVVEKRNVDEATKLLERVKGKYARADLFLATVAVQRGDNTAAADEIRDYLRSPSAMERKVAQDWLGNLEKLEQAAKSREGNGGGVDGSGREKVSRHTGEEW